MENLNNKNFFNDMQLKYPKTMAHFVNWLKEYQQEVMWNDLFYNSRRVYPKEFQDVPIAFQMGIMYEFIICKESGKRFLLQAGKNSVEKCFKDLEKQL